MPEVVMQQAVQEAQLASLSYIMDISSAFPTSSSSTRITTDSSDAAQMCRPVLTAIIFSHHFSELLGIILSVRVLPLIYVTSQFIYAMLNYHVMFYTRHYISVSDSSHLDFSGTDFHCYCLHASKIAPEYYSCFSPSLLRQFHAQSIYRCYWNIL